MRLALAFIIFSYLTNAFSAESANSHLAKARERFLQKDRLAAVQILQNGIAETKRESERAELVKELQRLSTVFLTEEGQKSFELAESLLYSAATGVEAKYEEALTKEPGNLQVLLGLARSRFARNDCGGANDALIEAEKTNPHSVEKKYLRARANHCLKTPNVKKSEVVFTGELKKQWQLLQVQTLVEDQKLREAQDMLFKESKDLLEWDMPEANYWRYKAMATTSPEAVEYAQKYIDQCKAITSSLRRTYKLEPRLCLNESEAEDFVKKSEAAK